MTDNESPDNKPAYERIDYERPASSTPPIDTIEYAKVTAPHDPYSAFRYRAFIQFEIGWLISVIGDQMLEVAVGWDLYMRTKDALVLGWVGLVTALPVILLALPAGHLADRINRRRIVIFTQIIWSFCAVAIGLLSYHHGPIASFYVLLAVAATCKAIGGPARASLLPMIVPTNVFANAVTWNSSAFQLCAMVGPALGGLIIIWSTSAAYFLSAGCSIVFVIFLFTLIVPEAKRTKEPITFEAFLAGVKFVRDTRIIMATITLDLFAVLLGGAVYLLPIFATKQLGLDSFGFGLLRAAPAIGALLMAIIVAHAPPMKRAGRAMLWAVIGFGAATIVFGLSHSFILSFIMLFLTGAFDNISVVVRHTLVQILTPDAMRGRVSAVNNIFIGASNELGGFESGLTARLFGPVTSVVAGGIGTILVVILVALCFPQIRRFGALTGDEHA